VDRTEDVDSRNPEGNRVVREKLTRDQTGLASIGDFGVKASLL